MKMLAVLKFAKSLIFPRSEKKSSARKSLFGALICIALSIVPLIVVTSITSGMIHGMTERLIGLSSGDIQAYVAVSDKVSSLKNFEEYSAKTLEVDGVVSAYPQIELFALAAGKTSRTGISIRALPKDIFEKNQSFKKFFKVYDGSLEDFMNAPENSKIAVIGKKMAETLGVKAGDSFKIITTKSVGGKITPKLTTFKIAAIVSSGYQELDLLWVFIPLESAFQFVSLSNANYTIMINTKDPLSSDVVRVQRELEKYFDIYANVYRWDEVHESEFENFSSTRIMLVFVMMLIVLVACVNVSSAVIMLVLERRNEIAILKSIGASPQSISLAFMLAGGACGAGGILIGLPVGILFSVYSNQIVGGIEKLLNGFVRFSSYLKGNSLDPLEKIQLMDPAYYLAEIPVELPFSQIFMIVCATLVLSVLVSVIPAIKAGREKPLDIFRAC